MPKAKRYDSVILLEFIDGFKQGDRGAIVEAYTTPYEAYDIEVFTKDGQTKGIAEATLPKQFKVISSNLSEVKQLKKRKYA